MIGELLERACELSVAWWLTVGALYLLAVPLLLAWLARWGEDFDDRRGL